MSQSIAIPEHISCQEIDARTQSQQNKQTGQVSHASHQSIQCAKRLRGTSAVTQIQRIAKPDETQVTAKLGQALVFLIELAERDVPDSTETESRHNTHDR